MVLCNGESWLPRTLLAIKLDGWLAPRGLSCTSWGLRTCCYSGTFGPGAVSKAKRSLPPPPGLPEYNGSDIVVLSKQVFASTNNEGLTTLGRSLFFYDIPDWLSVHGNSELPRWRMLIFVATQNRLLVPTHLKYISKTLGKLTDLE